MKKETKKLLVGIGLMVPAMIRFFTGYMPQILPKYDINPLIILDILLWILFTGGILYMIFSKDEEENAVPNFVPRR